MIIKFKNVDKHSLLDIIPRVEDIIKGTKESLVRDKDVTVTDTVISEIEITVGLNIEGVEETQFLTVEHHKGLEEPFTWLVDMNEPEAKANMEESFIDPVEAGLALGETPEFKEIEPKYPLSELTEEKVEEYGDMKEITYSTSDNLEEELVVKVFQGDKLVTEYGYKSIEEYEEEKEA